MKQGADWGWYLSERKLPAAGLMRTTRPERKGRPLLVGVRVSAFGRGVWFAPGWWKR